MSPSQTGSRLSAEDWTAGGLELLAEEGLAGVKIDVLARRLGVTKGSFYWHFANLSAFLDAMTERYCARCRAQIEAFDNTTPREPRARLRHLMERLTDPATWNLERAVRAWAYSNPRLHAYVAEQDIWAFGQVRACFDRLGFPPVEAEIRAKTLYYSGIGFLHTGSLGEPERREHREGLLALLSRS